MSDSLWWKLTRPWRFIKRFVRDPQKAVSDLAAYLSLNSPAPLLEQPSASPTPHTSQADPSGISQSLMLEITANFQVTDEFLRIFSAIATDINWSKPTWREFLAGLSPLRKLSVPFVMSTVVRGRNLLSLLESKGVIRKKDRYLDVGTGYAGFLRAAREIGFCEVVGIEYAEGLVTLARANIADLPAAQVVSQDFLTGDFSGLGVFDLITCNDVIEHVDDPQLAMQKMAALTNPEGCICFEVPNKDAIPFVKSDGHFLIFGITQLPKDEAAEYHAAQTGAEKSFYLHEMGEMYELDWYLERLQELGFSARLAETYSLGGLEKVPELLADLNQGYQEWQVNKAPLLDKAIAGRVVAAVEKYLETLDQDFAKAANDQAAQTKFQYKYLRSFWTIIAVKG